MKDILSKNSILFGMDIQDGGHGKQCFSFVYIWSHNQIIALPVENQSGKTYYKMTDLACASFCQSSESRQARHANVLFKITRFD